MYETSSQCYYKVKAPAYICLEFTIKRNLKLKQNVRSLENLLFIHST